jgi:hypothetical protein
MAIITGALDVGDETRDELNSMGVALHLAADAAAVSGVVDGIIGRPNAASPAGN